MAFDNIQTELQNRQLNIEKIFKLNNSNKIIVMKMFDDLMDSFYGEKGMSLPGGIKVDYNRIVILYNTLINDGYLVTKREKNLDLVLEE